MELERKVSPEEVVKKAFDAYNSHDAYAYAATLDPDYVGHDPLVPEPIKGREASRRSSEGLFKAMPDFEFRILNIVASRDIVAVEAMASGTLKGPLEFPGRTMPATGRRFEARLVMLVRVNSKGLIAEIRDYWYDLAGFLQQLGLKA